MENLKKQIKESFFNPVLYLSPLITFIITNNTFGKGIAWLVALSVAFCITVYVRFRYHRLLSWHYFTNVLFITIGVVISIVSSSDISFKYNGVIDKMTLVCCFIVVLALQKPIEKLMTGVMPKLIPMTNNLQEFFQTIKVFTLVLTGYVAAYLAIISRVKPEDVDECATVFWYVYAVLLIVLIVYEMLRVMFIRKHLKGEQWWPIVTKDGKRIGMIEHLTSLNDEKKYMHPIVRVIIFDTNRILMYKRSDDDFVAPNLWDASISKHVRVGDDLPKRIKSVLVNRYGMTSVKTSFLANYTYDAENEEQFVALYVGCASHKESKPTENGAKWWTLQQIEENLQENVFSPQFQIEYNILKRSGLIDNGTYECDCSLKELINRKKSGKKLSEDY
ncbi:MAG: hypothetical protein LBH80_02580 [Prevotellaceae bacterium]|jgi:isopentenyldiphosphate isomerase|nr:hypothetical protein [Prevotellaceae bacterium]